MNDVCEIHAFSAQETEKAGFSLSRSVYDTPILIALSGELGSGKTTFVRGFARGLYAADATITSPTYAVENRYGDALSHIDLHRLPKKSIDDMFASAREFPGITIVEWSDLGWPYLHDHKRIDIQIHETSEHERRITVAFHDMEIPTADEIAAMHAECQTPAHIIEHEKQVAFVALQCAEALAGRGIIIRKHALSAAAQLHDVLRIVNFKDPKPEEIPVLEKMRERFGEQHEAAAQSFLLSKGFPDIGTILRTHGIPWDEANTPRTIEQKILAYADKRVMHTTVVSVMERFADFANRYGGGEESVTARAWKESVLALERELFPEGPPL